MNYCKKALKEYIKDRKSDVGYPKSETIWWLKDFAAYIDAGLHLIADKHRKKEIKE